MSSKTLVPLVLVFTLAGCGDDGPTNGEKLSRSIRDTTEALCVCFGQILGGDSECPETSETTLACIRATVDDSGLSASEDRKLQQAAECLVDVYDEFARCLPADCSDDASDALDACLATTEDGLEQCNALVEGFSDRLDVCE